MKNKDFTFEGFDSYSSTCVPDVVFDVLLPILTGAELKALLYIIRRTLGFKKDSDTISLNQFHKGIKTKDGKQLDNGCGISDRTTLVQALNSLEKYGCIERQKTLSSQGDSDTTLYSIRYLEVVGKPDYPTMETRLGVVGKPDDGRYGNPTRGSRETRLGVVGKPDSQLNSNTPNSNTPNSKQLNSKQTNKKKLLTLQSFDFSQEPTIETIMMLGDIWRGSSLPVNKRVDSDYQKALNAATTLSQRLRDKDKHGYTLEEINLSYRFFKRIGEPGSIAEDWWKGKNVDLWVIAKNIDKALDTLSTASSPSNENTGEPALEDENRLVVWSKYGITKPREAVENWFMFDLMPVYEARQYGFQGREFVSNTRKDIANLLDHSTPEKLEDLRKRYLSKIPAMVSA